jgi:hypothetical protein
MAQTYGKLLEQARQPVELGQNVDLPIKTPGIPSAQRGQWENGTIAAKRSGSEME